ncbi:MAG: MFS transporter [Bacillota bacterium]
MIRKSSALHYGWIVALTGMLATLGAHGFGRFAYTLILPPMKEGLALSYTQAGLIGTGNFIGYLISAFAGGFLASKYNSRYVISLSLVLMSFTLFLTGLAQSFEWAFAMRLLTGIGNGAAYVPAMALGSVWFATRYRGLATGIVSSGTGTGIMLGSAIVPWIIAGYGPFGWRFAWYCLGGFLLFIGVVCFTFLRPRPESLGLSPFGEQRLPVYKLQDSKAGGSDPSGWRLICRSKTAWHFSAVYFMFGFSYVIYITFFAAYLKNEIGWSDARTSGLWALVGGLNILCGLIWGCISDRLGRRHSAALVYLALAVSYLLFASFKFAPALYLSAVIFGLSSIGVPTIMAAASGDYLGRRLAPAGLGFITLFFGIGQALGPAAGGYLADLSGTFTWTYVLAAAVSILGMAGSLLLPKPPAAEE